MRHVVESLGARLIFNYEPVGLWVHTTTTAGPKQKVPCVRRKRSTAQGHPPGMFTCQMTLAGQHPLQDLRLLLVIDQVECFVVADCPFHFFFLCSSLRLGFPALLDSSRGYAQLVHSGIQIFPPTIWTLIVAAWNRFYGKRKSSSNPPPPKKSN